MEIRHTKLEDLPEIRNIFAYARAQMVKNGNPTQWGNSRPDEKVVINDINLGISYLVINDAGEASGIFTFFEGTDPCYDHIEGRGWLNDEPYGVIHRVASNGKIKGILNIAVDYASQHVRNLRIDTHRDNSIMRHLVIKNGFTECGIVIVDDGTERIAYHKVIE